MREAYSSQPRLVEIWLDLDHAHELRQISELLDRYPQITEAVVTDLRATKCLKSAVQGAHGLNAEQVLRALLIKQLHGFSYRELAFHLADSRSFRTFCRFGITDPTPSKSALAAAIKVLRPETLEEIHRCLLTAAQDHKVEAGQKVRIDCTVVESNIHRPSDSELLWDGIRVLSRLLNRLRDRLGAEVVVFADRTRRAKRRRLEILNAKNSDQRRQAYLDLIAASEEVHRAGRLVVQRLRTQGDDLDKVATRLVRKLEHFLGLIQKVLHQTRRRVLEQESVPAAEKVVSLFEEHTDVIRKDGRETYYGHKICLVGGPSSLVLDCLMLEGNPADSTLPKTMIERQKEIFARPPRQAAFDGSFASKENLANLKAQGVEDVAFSKRAHLPVEEMAQSVSVYRSLRNFRAGIEGNISWLKRIFGLGRCTWRSQTSFRSYIWSSILAFNLLVLARHLLS